MGRLALVFLVASCGRIGFGSGRGSVTDGTDGSVDGSIDAAIDGSSIQSTIQYVAPIVQRLGPMGTSDTFTLQAQNAGDAIVMMVGCAGSQVPSGVTLSATGWTFTQISPLTQYAPAQIYAASFGAIAPDTVAASTTVTFTSSTCNRGKSEFADELSGVDATTPVDAHAEGTGAGNAMTTVTTGNAGDAVWGGVYSATMATAVGSGYTMGAGDLNGDFAEYKLTADAAGTPETVTFANPNGYVIVAATLKPR